MKAIWTAKPRGFMKTVNLAVITKSKDIADEAYKSLVELSPVRTGSFRASWRMSVNTVDTTKFTFTDVINPAPPPNPPVLKTLKYNDRIIISNSHEYGIYLENGSPSTLPIGMVRKTVAKLS